MNGMMWLRIAAGAVGLVAFAVLVWFGGPLLAFGEMRPLDAAWARLVLILALVVPVVGYAAYQFYRRRKAAEQLEKGISEADGTDSDAAVLQETMQDALATLRGARGSSRDYLYELPWYVIIGPPGSGKTTALVNSGLKFPLTRGGSPAAVAGVGGTRYCDWWFTEEAVLIDTAGRYTTQDSDPKSDRTSWSAFLDLLKRNRPRQPINGVLVAISLEDLLTLPQEDINAHAAAIRKRLMELHDRLKVDFPVYALFTKADLVAGFMEYFGQLNETERRMVWGHTFQTSDKTRNMIGEVPAEFDALIERLNEQAPDRLQDEPTPTARVVLFGFPSQMAAAKGAVVDFLNRIFEPTRYHANATLRGFYFTSGTQQGTPIDQLIGALAKSFGAEEVGGEAFSGLGKSYFLTDLLKKVIIGEAGWVSTNRAAVRRALLLKTAGYGGLAALLVVAGALWWLSYLRNSAMIAQTNAAVVKYRVDAAPVLRETEISDRDFTKVLPLLHAMRYMPTGYAVRDESVPLTATFGLSQRGRLQSASETAYRIALERMFRSRLIFRLEEQLEANRNNPGYLYDALKVYLMLGGGPDVPVDRQLIVSWMQRDWAENLYSGPANAKGRQALVEHLEAMLDLDLGQEPLIKPNWSLVQESQRTLARLGIAERAYQRLKSDANQMNYADWLASARAGPDAGLVFEALGGQSLDSVRVPYFFTYDGFYQAFIDRFNDIGELVAGDQWVLGEAGKQAAVTQQYGTLFADLLKLYTRDFLAAWQQTLRKLRLRPLNADRPKYVALSAAAAPTSPIKQLLESIRDETRLTRERPGGKAAGGGTSGAGGGKTAAAGGVVGKALGQAAERKASSVIGSTTTSTLSTLGGLAAGGQPSARPEPPGGGRNEAPGANIEALFKQFHVLVDGDRPPIEALLQNLSEINQNLAVAANNPAQAAQANNALVTQVASLRANASRFPQPFEQMIRAAASDFEGDATGASAGQLAQEVNEISRVCQQIVANRYPFVRGSEREVPMGDFGRLFGPGGILDKFFNQSLAPLAEQSKKQWTWRLDSPLARKLSLATLREFQRAAEIRDAFFPTGGIVPSVGMTVTPLSLSTDTTTAKLEINGQSLVSQQGANGPGNLQWPGSGIGRTAITLTTGGGGFFSSPTPLPALERNGTWSLYRLLEAGSVLAKGDGIVASFVVGGREISYQFNVNSVANPLTLPALREFRCPSGI